MVLAAPYTQRRSLMDTVRPLAYRASQQLLAPHAANTIRECARQAIGAVSGIDRALDIGCGPKSVLRDLGLRPVGIDLSAAQLSAFAMTGAAALGTAVNLPFRAHSFDLVWSCGLLHHLDDGPALLALREMARVVRPHGRVVLFDGVLPECPARRPIAALIRRFDRGSWMRAVDTIASLFDTSGLVWSSERMTYAVTGLEGVLIVARPLAT